MRSKRGEEEMFVKINDEKCLGCDFCVVFCPEYALSVSRDTFKCRVDEALCTGCLTCVDICQVDAIEEVQS